MLSLFYGAWSADYFSDGSEINVVVAQDADGLADALQPPRLGRFACRMIPCAEPGGRSVPRGPWILGRTIFLGIPFLAGEPFAARRDEKNHEQSG